MAVEDVGPRRLGVAFLDQGFLDQILDLSTDGVDCLRSCPRDAARPQGNAIRFDRSLPPTAAAALKMAVAMRSRSYGTTVPSRLTICLMELLMLLLSGRCLWVSFRVWVFFNRCPGSPPASGSGRMAHLRSALASIWRMRSRVTLNFLPTSSSVREYRPAGRTAASAPPVRARSACPARPEAAPSAGCRRSFRWDSPRICPR